MVMPIDAAFLDIFGFVAFLFLIYAGVYARKKSNMPKWIGWLVLAIGWFGAVVDGSVIALTYFI